jgi:hypothetical protein
MHHLREHGSFRLAIFLNFAKKFFKLKVLGERYSFFCFSIINTLGRRVAKEGDRVVKIQNGLHKQRSGQHTLVCQKIHKKSSGGWIQVFFAFSSFIPFRSQDCKFIIGLKDFFATLLVFFKKC